MPRPLDGVRFPPMASPSEPDGRARRDFISRGHRGLFRNDFRLLHERDSTPFPPESETSSLHCPQREAVRCVLV